VCRDTDHLWHTQVLWPYLSLFWASCSWWSEGLFGQYFSVALPIQELTGLPCLGSFSVVWCVRHIEGPPQSKQLHHLHAQLSLGQSCHRWKKKAWVVFNSLQPCGLWPARFFCQGEGFSRQEYWSTLANTACHTLLELYISCFPSHQPPWVPGAARNTAAQAAAPPPHLALTGHTEVLQGSLRRKPQWTTQMQRWK